MWWSTLKKHSNTKEWIKASRTCDEGWSQPGDDVYTDREVNVCSGQMVTNTEKMPHERVVICMFNSCHKLIKKVRGDQWSARASPNNAVDEADEDHHYAPSPTTFKTPQTSPPWKKKPALKPPTPIPPLFLFPATLSHPISTTAPLPAPGFCCTNQEQMSAGAVLKDPAVLDASHMLFIQRWRLTARLLVKPI